MIGVMTWDTISLTTKRFCVVNAMSEEKSSLNEEPVSLEELAEAIQNGLANEYDDGSWGLDLGQEEDPTYEATQNKDSFVIIVKAGAQRFRITLEEET